MTEQPATDEWLRARKATSDAAKLQHEGHRIAQRANAEFTITFGTEALKAVGLVSSGACIATMAFISQAYEKQPTLTWHLVQSLKHFAMALFLSTISAGLAYAAQYLYTISLGRQRYAWERPFITWTNGARWAERGGMAIHFLAFASVVAAYAFLLVGFWNAQSALEIIFPLQSHGQAQ